MVVARSTTLAAMALFALFTVANAICGSDTYGTVTQNKVKLEDVTLTAGQRTFEIDLPSTACPDNNPVGSTVSACDYDVAPVVTHTSVLHAVVQRMGKIDQSGVVHSYVYCS